MIDRLSLTLASGRWARAHPGGARAIRLVEFKSFVQDRHPCDLPSADRGWISERLTESQALKRGPIDQIAFANQQAM